MLEGLTPPKSKAIYCKVDLWLQKLDDNDKEILLAALLDWNLWPHASLARELRARGMDISDTTIGKHRHRDCACYKD